MKATILIVNISKTFGKLLKDFFEKQDFDVLIAKDALEAFRMFIMHPVDLILTDYHMPNISGSDLVKTFRSNKEHKDLPIVVFTGSLTPELEKECKEAGASLVLPKSHEHDKLMAAIKKLVEEYKESRMKTGIDLDLAKSTIEATKQVMETMMNMQVEAGEASFQKVKPQKADVIGSVGVAGFLSGSITLFMNKDLAKIMTARMLMIEPDEIESDEEMIDAIGEVTNMVAGNIKTHLFKKVPLFDISTPSVTIGQEVKRTSIASSLCFIVPFRWEGKEFKVEFLLVSNNDKDSEGVSLKILTSANA